MKLLVFRDFSIIFLNFSEFLRIFNDFSNLKSNFQIIYSAQVTWRDLKHPIASRSNGQRTKSHGSGRSVRS